MLRALLPRIQKIYQGIDPGPGLQPVSKRSGPPDCLSYKARLHRKPRRHDGRLDSCIYIMGL
jgi:hypothetical protein